MKADDKSGSSEFSNFLEDVAHEISERVQAILPTPRHTPETPVKIDELTRIIEWPVHTDRIIDELR
jgi:hypothetical protein